MTKQELRQHIRQQKALFTEQFPVWSQQLCQAIAASPRWQSAQVVLLYHALPDEPDLQRLLDKAVSEGKQVLLPVVVNDDLVLKRYKGYNSLREGAFHILEPTGRSFPQSRYAEIDLALVPGMAFDREGRRLGRGRGYYDRLLPRIPYAYKLGVCFPFQLLPVLSSEPHDIPVNEVINLSLLY